MLGEYVKEDGKITIETKNSIYVFEKGDFEMTESQKKELLLNCI